MRPAKAVTNLPDAQVSLHPAPTTFDDAVSGS